MVNFLRTCGGRVSMGAWRSKKCVLWTVCFVASVFVVFVQYSSSSMNGVLIEPQQHRSLHSVHQHMQDESVYQKSHDHVRFVDNDYIKTEEEDTNDAPERSIKDNRKQPSGGAQSLPSFPPPVQNVNDDKDQKSLFREKNKPDANYVGNAAAAWNGGSFRYNPYGEPVYNHDNKPNYIPKERMIHLDLKGSPPRLPAYKTFLPWLSKNGATSILIEYEDMFPFDGVLSSLSAKNHYTKEEIQEILALCKEHNLEVVPLIQTFGHLEFALKLEKYSYLREVPQLPQALCPSHTDSLWLVKTMVDQIMALHPGVKYLHIGCDEVFQMGVCDKCRMKSRENIFLDHISNVAKYVRATHGVIPIIWHDMLTHVSSSAMNDYNFGELVEPMVWVYAEDVYRFVQPTMWTKFSQVFPTVWGASAFKGAFGEQSTVPNVRRHLDNNLNWLDVMASEAPKFSGGFRGLVLTGWQRHDHFAVLCELLPSAIPSLAVNLISTSHGFFNETIYPQLYQSLNCLQNSNYQTVINLDSDPFLWDKFSWCYFPGSAMFKVTARLDMTRRDVRSYIDRVTLKRGWLSDYNRRHNFSSPMRVDEDLEELPSRLQTLNLLVRTAKDALLEWFDEWTTGEWIEQHIWPLLHQLETLQEESESMKLVKTWPVRPLPLLPELKSFGIRKPSRKSIQTPKENLNVHEAHNKLKIY